jgi:HSP20 family protein
MTTVKWNPLREFATLREEFERAFDDSLFRSETRGVQSPTAWVPPVDIYETADRIVLKTEIPGINRDEVMVEISENTLTLSGEKRMEREVEEANYHRLERVFGRFERRFSLTESVDREKVKAVYKDGVLEISLPKLGRVQPIQVKVKID